MRFPRSPRAALGALSALTALAACGTTTGLPPAHIVNVVDTVSLYALDGTPLTAPSAYDVELLRTVRTDVTTAYDFIFNIDTAGRALLLPTGAAGLGKQSGLRVESVSFDAVTDAPTSGYVDSTAVAVDSGTVAVVRSRPIQCSFGVVVFLYAKIEVLKIDRVARRLDFRILADLNCGYRQLQPGLPTR